MSAGALDRLIASQEALIAALDGDTAEAIEAAMKDFAAAIEGVRAPGGWRDAPDVVARVKHALALGEAARIRTRYLADRTRRQIDRLALLGAPTRSNIAYGRNGRVRA